MSTSQTTSVTETVKGFILDRFLAGEDPAALTDTTPLISAGIIDSVATLSLVAFLEETFAIRIEAHEVDIEHLNTVSDIVRFVETKRVGH